MSAREALFPALRDDPWEPTWRFFAALQRLREGDPDPTLYTLRERARTADRTAWPETDGSGNNLRHTELCAWRFGGKCDCDA